MKKVLITGALGYIGSHLLRTSPNWDITILDNLSAHRHCAFYDLGRPVQLIEGDILNSSALAQVLDGQEMVVHLAALTDAEASVVNPEPYYRVNTEGTLAVAQGCAVRSIPLLYVSTTSVYGPQQQIVDESLPVGNCRAHSPYAASKLLGETAINSVPNSTYTILRCGTCFGFSQGIRYQTVVGKFCWLAATGQALTIWDGAWGEQRPYADIQDITRAIHWAVDIRDCHNELFNVVTGNYKLSEIVACIREWIPDVAIRWISSPLLNQMSYPVSAQRIQDAGFRFHGDLRRGILDVLRKLNVCPRDTEAAWQLAYGASTTESKLSSGQTSSQGPEGQQTEQTETIAA